jgi:hypothetical protein
VSAYDKVIDSAEAMVKSAGANVPRETLEESIKNAGMNPNVRHGFGAYIGMNTLDTNPETVKKIHSSPLVSAMQEGYESIAEPTKPGLRVGTPASSTTVFDLRKSAASDMAKATVPKAESSAVRATVASSAPIKATSEVASEVASATASRTTKTMLESVSDLSRSVTKGHGGSTGLLIAGAAAILGVAGANRARSNNENKR